MTAIWVGIISALKNILLKVISEKFFTWLFFWSAQALVDSTKTKFDDELIKQIKEVYYEQSNRESLSGATRSGSESSN